VASLFADAGLICIAAFISPYRADRDSARVAARNAKFCEIYVEADVASCEERDPKGLYKKARSGLVKNFTGIDAPYEAPVNPELVIDTKRQDVDESVDQLLAFVTMTFPLA
jgi:adenylyl-sulfate kinase